MGTAKVDYFGQTLIDLTNDTITPETLLKGITAHDANGDPIVGTLIGGGSDEWLYEAGVFFPNGGTHTVNHNLGKKPDIFYIKINLAFEKPTGPTNILVCMFGMSDNLLKNIENVGTGSLMKVVLFGYQTTSGSVYTSTYREGFDTFTSNYPVYVTDETISFGSGVAELTQSLTYSWGVFAKK